MRGRRPTPLSPPPKSIQPRQWKGQLGGEDGSWSMDGMASCQGGRAATFTPLAPPGCATLQAMSRCIPITAQWTPSRVDSSPCPLARPPKRHMPTNARHRVMSLTRRRNEYSIGILAASDARRRDQASSRKGQIRQGAELQRSTASLSAASLIRISSLRSCPPRASLAWCRRRSSTRIPQSEFPGPL